MSVRFVLADDHAILRDALRTFLEKQGFTIAGEASDGAEAVRVTRSVRPNIVIMDLSMPVMNGIDAAEEIRRESGTQIILLTMYSEQHHILRAFRAGVAAYVLKAKAASDLLLAISEVSRGNIYLSPGISATVVREMLHKGPVQSEVLTLRERQVLQLVAEGKSTKELAEVLSISVRTGESHRSRIMEKLQIHETAGLVRYAIREGFVQA
jgi:two-component system, NarL family, response regulator NreC